MSDVEQYFAQLRGTEFDDEVWGNAPCTELADPDMWFDIDGHATNDRLNDLRIALETCNSCYLRTRCLKLGMNSEDLLWGIWGGLFPAERQVLAGNGHYVTVQRQLQSTKAIRKRLGVAKPTGDSNE